MAVLHRFFFYATIILLPTQLALHFWPQWAFILGRRVDYLSPTLYLTDILIFLTIALGWLEKKSSIVTHKIFIPALIFAGINILMATNKQVALFHWFKIAEFAIFAWYIIKTKPNISRVAFFLSIAVFYSSVVAIAQFLLQHAMGGPLWFLGERTFTNQTPGIAQINWCIPAPCRLLLRPYATFPHPNVLGGFLAITIPVLMGQISLIRQMGKTKKTFVYMAFSVGLTALFLTFSRSAWLIAALGIGWIFVPKKLKPVYVLGSAAVFLIGIFLVKDLASPSESVIVREQLNASAISLFRHSPIFGIGLGNFLVELPKVLPSRTIYFLQPVHNIYLLVLAETGVIGLFVFLLFLWRVIRNMKYVIGENLNSSNVSRFTSHISLFSLLLLGLVDHYPLTLQQGQLLLTLFLSFALATRF